MGQHIWQIKINLRYKNGPVITLASRSETGKLLRDGGLVNDRKQLAQVVANHFDMVDEYDFTLHERAHELALKAAEAQVEKYTDKEAE